MSETEAEFHPPEDRQSTRRVLTALLRISSMATSSVPRDQVLRDILGAVEEGLGYDRVALYLLQPGTTVLEGVLGVGSGSSTVGVAYDLDRDDNPQTRVVRTGIEQVRGVGRSAGGTGPGNGERDARGHQACVPVWVHERVVGALGVDRVADPAGIPEGEVEVLKIFANQVGIVIENRALHEENQAKIDELMALERISRQMSSTLDIARLLKMVVDEAIRLTGARGGLLYLLEDSAERLRLKAWAGDKPPPSRRDLPVGYGIPGWVARAGKPLRVADQGTHEDAGYGTRKSQLAVPLLSEGRVVGVLAVEGEADFTATHEEIATIFAAQAAKAIEAVRFFEAVREERDLREKILDGTPNGVVAVDEDRRVVLMNQSARRLLGVQEDPLGNPVGRYLAQAAFRERLRKVALEGAPLETIELTQGSGERARHLMVNVFSLGREGGRGGATVIIEDLTERRKLDERVQRMARLASIGQLAAGVAHEIRNPLTGVAISLDILGEEVRSEAGRGLLEDINREIDRLEALIRGLLDFARPQPVQRRPMRITKALEWLRTFQEQCRKKGIQCRLEGQRDLRLLGDPEKLKQLFLNLAINALEATPSGGQIRIRTESAEGETGRAVQVTIEDTGSGMDEETLAQVFDPFFTTKNEGTGLGLSIAYSIVEQHGGRIDVTSEPNLGTRFTVELPALPVEEV